MKQIFLCLFVLIMTCTFSHAQLDQIIEISSAPSPVGSGARALGMGGAFIAVADDATAASWNPAGLIQLERPEVSFVGAYKNRAEDTSYKAFPEASGPQRIDSFDLNYASAACPFSFLHRNMIVSINYQDMYDFDKKVRFSYNLHDAQPPALDIRSRLAYDQDGGLYSLSPAIAVQVTPSISLGMTVNFWDPGIYENNWKSRNLTIGRGTFGDLPFETRTAVDQSYAVSGMGVNGANLSDWRNINFHIGLLWNINSRLVFGLVFKSPFILDLHHQYAFDSEIAFAPPDQALGSHNTDSFTESVRLKMPASYGAGLSYRFSDAFTMDIDLSRTQWNDYVLHDGQGNAINPVTGKDDADADVGPTLQARIGGEYLFIRQGYAVPVRAGLFYDPEPADNHPDPFYGISVGTGIAWGAIVFDCAYQYRFGRDVRSTTVGNEKSSQDVDQHLVYASVIYHF